MQLGGLAASDVAGARRRSSRSVGPELPVLVARTRPRGGARLAPAALAVRRVPRATPRPARTARPPRSRARARRSRSRPAPTSTPPLLDDGTARRARGAGAADRASGSRRSSRSAPAQTLAPGARVDVLVTREGAGGAAGATTLALEDVEVLAAGRAPEAGGSGPDAGLPRVALDCA